MYLLFFLQQFYHSIQNCRCKPKHHHFFCSSDIDVITWPADPDATTVGEVPKIRSMQPLRLLLSSVVRMCYRTVTQFVSQLSSSHIHICKKVIRHLPSCPTDGMYLLVSIISFIQAGVQDDSLEMMLCTIIHTTRSEFFCGSDTFKNDLKNLCKSAFMYLK